MATWRTDCTFITNEGLALIAKLALGDKQLELTRSAFGSGRVPEAMLARQTALTDEVKNLVFTDKRVVDNSTVIQTQLTNEGVTAQTNINQLGYFANDPDKGEILYLITQCDQDTADKLPAYADTPTVLSYSIQLFHENGVHINATVDLAGYVNNMRFNEYKAEVTETLNNYVLKTGTLNLNTVEFSMASSKVLPVSAETLPNIIGKITKYLHDWERSYLMTLPARGWAGSADSGWTQRIRVSGIDNTTDEYKFYRTIPDDVNTPALAKTYKKSAGFVDEMYPVNVSGTVYVEAKCWNKVPTVNLVFTLEGR